MSLHAVKEFALLLTLLHAIIALYHEAARRLIPQEKRRLLRKILQIVLLIVWVPVGAGSALFYGVELYENTVPPEQSPTNIFENPILRCLPDSTQTQSWET